MDKITKIVSLFLILAMISSLSGTLVLAADVAADAKFTNGSVTNAISGQTYYYSVTSSGGGRYDEFYITTSGASQISAVLDGQTTDDLDLYYRAGARVSGCGSYTCSTYTQVSWTSGADESITVTNPADTTHWFRIQRYSGYGRDYYYFTITVTGGGGGDTTAPTVSITAPSNGATVSGTVTVSASASDNVGVDRVEFRVDGALKFTDYSAPYSFNWDTTTASNGGHTVSATAFDAAGNSNADSISVTVSNGGGGGTGCGETPRVTGSMPWWNDAIDVEKAHAAGCYGGDTVVVVLDTGLGSGYSSLFPAGSILSQYSKSYTKSLGYDNVDWNQDTEGHGTSVTATILGYYVPSTWGMTNNYVMGVAPNAEVVMLRVVYWVGGSVTYSAMIDSWVQAINYAISLHNGALAGKNMVISMSLGYDPSAAPSSANAALESAINNAVANGIVVSTSAGNDGPSPNTTGNPANFANSVSVAAAGWNGYTGAYGVAGIDDDLPEDNFADLVIADFSSRGKVEITGIGWNLALPTWDNTYKYISGTSFSCPQVSGVFALMFSMYGSQSVSFMVSTMQAGAYAIGPSTTWGAGFVQADGALGI